MIDSVRDEGKEGRRGMTLEERRRRELEYRAPKSADGSMKKRVLTGRPLRLLYSLYAQGRPSTVYTIKIRQRELAERLGVTRQALNIHLRELRNRGYIRTGRGFIDVTEEGLGLLGGSANVSFVFIRFYPSKREEAYQKMANLPVRRIYRVAGDMDALLILDRERLQEVLRKLNAMDEIQDAKTYITEKTIK